MWGKRNTHALPHLPTWYYETISDQSNAITDKETKKMQTYPGIISTVQRLLTRDIGEILATLTITTTADKHIFYALMEQTTLGYNSFEKGFISKHWRTSQQYWCTSINKSEWEIKFVQHIQDYTYMLWKHRNEFIHGITLKDSIKEKRQRLREKVKELYNWDRSDLTTQEKKHFNVPLQQKIKGGIDNLTIWIRLVEIIFENSEKVRQTKITNWTSPSRNLYSTGECNGGTMTDRRNKKQRW